jgi:hypothetical protein
MKKNHPDFLQAHADCYNFWLVKEKQGQFVSIIKQVKENPDYKWMYP